MAFSITTVDGRRLDWDGTGWAEGSDQVLARAVRQTPAEPHSFAMMMPLIGPDWDNELWVWLHAHWTIRDLGIEVQDMEPPPGMPEPVEPDPDVVY